MHGVPDRYADRSEYPGQDKEHAHPISDEPGAQNADAGANAIGAQGVEAPVGKGHNNPDALTQDMGASTVQDAETTRRIGRERMAGSGTGGKS